MPAVLAMVAAWGVALFGARWVSGVLSGTGANPDGAPSCWIIAPENGHRVQEALEITLGFEAREVVSGKPTGSGTASSSRLGL